MTTTSTSFDITEGTLFKPIIKKENTDKMIGSVCAASNGSLAVVIKKKSKRDKTTGKAISRYCGISLSGRPWISNHPKFISASLEEYIKQQEESLSVVEHPAEEHPEVESLPDKDIEKEISSERKSYIAVLRRIKMSHNRETGIILDGAIEAIAERAKARRELRKEHSNE